MSKIKYSLPVDHAGDGVIDEFGSYHLASIQIFLLAGELYKFLIGRKGRSLIHHLRTKKKEIVLYQIDTKTKGFSLLRVVLSSKGLVLQRQEKGVLFEDKISCISVCYSGKAYLESVFSQGELVPWIEREFKRLIGPQRVR